MQGTGSYKFGSIHYDDERKHFIAELVEAPNNYFGLKADEPSSHFLPTLTFLTEPDVDARVPAVINLDSFGIRAGIQYSF